MYMHPVCLCLSDAHQPMTLAAAAEELAPEYKDVICEGGHKQILIVFFAGGLRSRPDGGRYGSAEAERGRRGVGLRSRLTNDWWAATETPLNAVCGAGASTRSSPTHMWRAWTPRASTNRFWSPCPSRPWSGGGSSRAADAAREA